MRLACALRKVAAEFQVVLEVQAKQLDRNGVAPVRTNTYRERDVSTIGRAVANHGGEIPSHSFLSKHFLMDEVVTLFNYAIHICDLGSVQTDERKSFHPWPSNA